MIMSDKQATAIQNKTARQLALETPGEHLDRLLQGKSTARNRQRAVESPDHRALRLERQREYQRAYRRRKAVATTEQIPGESEGTCSLRSKRYAVNTTEKRAVKRMRCTRS